MKHPRLRAGLCAATLWLAACGGGGATDNGSTAGGGPPAQTGVLIDSPVAGIGYRTATQSGVTDADGRYRYLPGETVTFFVGNVTLPPVAAKGTVTPFDLANSTDSNHQIAINVASFLQSLDADANPGNGISIPDRAAGLAAGGIDFNVPNSLFSQNGHLIALVRDANPGGRTVVDADSARAHLLQSLARLDASSRPNLAPIAEAAATASAVQTGLEATFSGAQSEDPNGDPLSYRWTLSVRPEGSQAVLPPFDAEHVTFTTDVAGIYTVSLVVSDGTLDSATATASVLVADPPPQPPPQVTLTGLSIGPAPAKLAVGGTHGLTATASYSDGSTAVVTAHATWTSSAPGTAAVDEITGALSGVAAGTAQVSASFGGATAGPVMVEVVALDSPVVLPSVSGIGQFTARWTPVNDAESYRIYYAEGTSGVTTSSTTIDGASIGQLVDGLTPGSVIHYRVGAVLGNHVQLSAETSAYVYANGQPSGSFQTTAAPNQTWGAPRAVRLDDGRVLIIGRSTAIGHPAEVYDPVTNTFAFVSSAAGPVGSQGSATLLVPGKVLYAGGREPPGGSEQPHSRTYLFDPVTDALIAGPTLPWASERHTAPRLHDGRVLIAGGRGAVGALDQTALYDPIANTFTPGPNLLVPREDHSAVLLHDGRVLIAAGRNATFEHVSSEIYDPATNTIAPAGTLADGGGPRTTVMLTDGRVLFAGGFMHARAEVFDPGSGTFSPVGTLTVPRSQAAATRLPDGRVLIAGGFDGSQYLDSAELFDPATNQFTPAGTMPIRPWGYPRVPVLLRDGRVFELNDGASYTYGP